MQEERGGQGEESARLVWDWPVRLFHWSLTLAVFGSWASAETGRMQLHFWFGYCVIGLLVFRLVWGGIGTRYARFANFVSGPKTVFAYLKALPTNKWQQSVGHSPIGAIGVFVLLFALTVQAASGLFTTDDIFWPGPYNAAISLDLGDAFSSLHRTNFKFLTALIGLHVLAVISYLVFKSTNLIGPMLSGRKRAAIVASGEGAERVSCLRIALAIGAAILVVALILLTAIEPMDDYY